MGLYGRITADVDETARVWFILPVASSFHASRPGAFPGPGRPALCHIPFREENHYEQRKKNPDLQSISDDSLESVSGGIARGTAVLPVQPIVSEIAVRPGVADKPVQPGTGELSSIPGKITPVQPGGTETAAVPGVIKPVQPIKTDIK